MAVVLETMFRYAVGVQEATADTFFEAIAFWLKNKQYVYFPLSNKVQGRGDGAFVYSKYTGP